MNNWIEIGGENPPEKRPEHVEPMVYVAAAATVATAPGDVPEDGMLHLF